MSQPVYDLLITGGRLIDPAQGQDGQLDVAILDGKVAAVAQGLPRDGARHTVDARSQLVVPGLVDLHEHVYWQATALGLEPDAICGRTGVTTVVDAGSAGANTYAGLRQFVVEPAKTRVIPFLHVSSIGLSTMYECRCLDHVDIELAAACIRRDREQGAVIGGMKVRANKSGVGDNGILPVQLARDLADATGLPLMVDMYYPPPSVEQVFPLLRSGDISTHMYKGYQGGLLRDGNSRVRECALAARERGVTFDLGHGAGSFAWQVAVPATGLGFFPDSISTDLHSDSVRLPDCDMPNCMAKMMALGASLQDVVRWSTANPAQSLRRDDIGSLRLGASGDVTVLELSEGDFTYYDSARNPHPGAHGLRAVLTACRGVITYELPSYWGDMPRRHYVRRRGTVLHRATDPVAGKGLLR